MKTRTVILSIALLAFLFFVKTWLNHPLPDYEGEKSLPVNKNVDVFTDDFGVPHIFAENEEDLFFVAGYIAARDRLFQLSMVSLAVNGELASVLGEDYLKTDIYLRTWKIKKTAELLVKNMKKENKVLFKSFCEGINYRIKETASNLPIEFKIIGFKPNMWNPVTVAGYTRMMAHEMQGSWKPEIVFGAVLEYFGKEKLLDLIPSGEYDIPTITGTNFSNKRLFAEIIEQENYLRDLLGDHSADIGSNNWVVSGKRTNTGMPFLANDPHLAFTQPPRWYEIHLKGGRFNVSGACIAGIPMPILGQNENVAWGFTNSMVDDVDFFIVELDKNNQTKYWHDNEWRKIKETTETISVKDKEDVVVKIRSTHHGPIISDIHPLLKGKSQVVAMSWTGHWITNEMDAWVKLTTMKNWEDFTEALKDFGVPGQNIVYADTEGNIGWRPAVYIPIRREGFSMLPRPGNNKDYDWIGKVPFEDMPFLFNPASGFISTANNKTIGDDFPYYISGLWADPSRANRIEKVLEKSPEYNLDIMKNLQLDYTSEFGLKILKYIHNYDKEFENDGLNRAVKTLKEWDGIESKESIGALLFHIFIRNLTINIYGDEFELLGKEFLDTYMSLKYIKDRKLREVFETKKSTWVDNVNTPGIKETLEDIIYKSYEDMYNEVVDRFGINKSNWMWGDAHSLTHKHILSKIKILDYLFSLNVGPFKSGGSSWTPNAGGYSLYDPYFQTSGASMRRIVDFSNLNETLMILPTGQSGLHNSPHYNDQAKLYHSGKYKKTFFDEDYIRGSNNFKKLKITPK